jgi:hypothetical protein
MTLFGIVLIAAGLAFPGASWVGWTLARWVHEGRNNLEGER